MKLFHWNRSEALRGVRSGHLLVQAETADEARSVLRERIQEWLREHRSWFFTWDGEIEPDEEEDYAEWMAKFEADLAREPEIVTHALITGAS